MTEATAKLRVVIESVDFEQGTRVVKRNLDEIASRANSAMSALDRINKSLNILKTVAGAYLSFRGIKSMVDQLIDASKSLEDYRMTMRAVIHDAGEADEAFERIKKWAAQNPSIRTRRSKPSPCSTPRLSARSMTWRGRRKAWAIWPPSPIPASITPLRP